jgi:2-dehydropantoate 2-reductase
MGAGSVGGYVGGLLTLAGVPVHFVGRGARLQGLRDHGLRLTDADGLDKHLPGARLSLHTSVPSHLHPDLTLLCVKSGATAEAAALLAQALPPGTLAISLQNGLTNANTARQHAAALDWRPGLVPFNVAELGPGHLHRGSQGALAVEGWPTDVPLVALQTALQRVGMGLELHGDLRPAQWAKLLLNLNNPINALSGLLLRDQLLEAGYRRCLAALQEEALDLLDAAHLPVARLTAVSPRALLRVLRLPTPLFKLAAARMLRIDPQARSSMADDLQRGQPTEIDMLCGEVQRLAARLGRQAPRNARMQALVQGVASRPRHFSPADLCRALGVR